MYMPADEKLAAEEDGIVAADDRWFRAVADYTYDWESWHGPDGRPIWVSLAVERITGYSVADCLAMEEYPLAMIAFCPGLRATIRR